MLISTKEEEIIFLIVWTEGLRHRGRACRRGILCRDWIHEQRELVVLRGEGVGLTERLTPEAD